MIITIISKVDIEKANIHKGAIKFPQTLNMHTNKNNINNLYKTHKIIKVILISEKGS